MIPSRTPPKTRARTASPCRFCDRRWSTAYLGTISCMSLSPMISRTSVRLVMSCTCFSSVPITFFAIASYFAVMPSKAAQFLYSSRNITSQSSRPLALPDRMRLDSSNPCFLASSLIFLRNGSTSRM
ncbi:MAG: hypothetical protein E6H66_20285 [Betaproteobacteria bacterium]|nr:MAG: hypothetical protein E6H66_20285 [Betaproteobacteria bacterium]